MNRPIHRGSAHTPILVFLGIVGLSIVFFFIFSAGSLTRKSAGASATRTPGPTPAATEPVSPPSDTPDGASAPTESTPAGLPQPTYFTTAEALLTELAARIEAGKPDEIAKLVGSAARADFLVRLVAECGWRVSTPEPWSDAGAMAGVSRYALKLEPSAPATPAPAGSVTFDIERTRTEGWKGKSLRFDAALVSQAAGLLKSAATGPDPAALTDPPDPLDQARRFFSAVLGHEFKAARGLTDPTGVTHEKLAGMCIVLEDGEYQIASTRPVVVTAGTADTAWAIVKIHSDKQNFDGEVGLEMERTAAGEWRIHALDFNKMLETYVQASGSGKVFYSPIVKSARGGESIVVYFEFDKAGLHPRALHQLDIISGLLKSDPARKMRITGHTDALGSDDYNVRLSAARAKNVHARLIELGVAAAQIETIGFGAKAPLDPNRREDGTDNPEGRSRNRRTEIYLDF